MLAKTVLMCSRARALTCPPPSPSYATGPNG